MANFLHHHLHHHHNSNKKQQRLKGFILVSSCAGLLGVGLVVNFLWASSSYFSAAYQAVASGWDFNSSPTVVVPNVDGSIVERIARGKYSKNQSVVRLLSATYADLPAPELQWEQMALAPVPRLDGSAIQIKNLLYVFSGYGSLDYVHSHVDVYNFTNNKWSERFDAPREMANSHLGVATDGRYIYVISGQNGPQCRGPTARSFVLDTNTKKWWDMPPLPAPRYAPATQIWRGRLHVMGGSKENRHTPAVEHWSIAVKDGKALEKGWQTEIPIPRGGPHRAGIAVNDRLFVIGGQRG
ncbi:kelch repeat-containing protein At3g27220-like [Carica papaya]|uniref:kelch repeat-containing protein At3g27220-like n=1 Tax=Carica papaya TaxID=3649 RepID=UPI000B8CF3D9|nr:kelch repeat-containing protein At3g27220-like [Carica papaya]